MICERLNSLGLHCVGCRACVASCPHNCINMCEDALGFRYPFPASGECVKCGLCLKSCPLLIEKDASDSLLSRQCYWAKATDDNLLYASSSGGVFGVLARCILEDDGIVYGVAFDHSCTKVHHVRVDKVSELTKIHGSKYLQSEMGNSVYLQLEKDLRQGRSVLFSGTACQIAAIRSYKAGKFHNANNLFCIDVVCHGVPSAKSWQEWLKYLEDQNGSKISSVNFRSKVYGWNNFSVEYTFENGNSSSIRSTEDWWYKNAFLANSTLRPSCFSCAFKLTCGSDMTIGDYWGIQREHPYVDDENGVSAVMVNTDKGLKLFRKSQGHLLFGETSFYGIVRDNPCIESPSKPYRYYDSFVRDIEKGIKIESLMRKYSFKKPFHIRLLEKIKRELRNLFLCIQKKKEHRR